VPFQNEPFINFTTAENKKAFEQALKQVKSEFGQEYPLIIGGERIVTEEKIQSINPSNVDETIGYVSKANEEVAERAMQAAVTAFHEWKHTPPDARARILFKAAAILRRRKHEFSAWMVYEAGKTWAEADGDTAEAVDFLEFYGREMLR